jgi:hypothetical protein
MSLDPRIGLCIALAVLWVGAILIGTFGGELLPKWLRRAPRSTADRASAIWENRRTLRAGGGRFRAPIVKFDPSNRTALNRKHLTALTKAGDRSA